MHLLGKHYFESGDLAQAEQWYLRSIEQGNVDSMVNIGVLYFTDGDFDKAKYWYQHASDFGESLATYNMGVLLGSIGKREEAIEWYFKAVELGEKNALLNLALLLNETGRKQESIEWYYKAIASDSEKLNAVCYAFAHCQIQIHFLNDYTPAHFGFYDDWSDKWDRLNEIHEGEIEPTDEDVALIHQLFDEVVRSELIKEIVDMIE